MTVDPDVAQKMAEAILAHEKAGDYDAGQEWRGFRRTANQVVAGCEP